MPHRPDTDTDTRQTTAIKPNPPEQQTQHNIHGSQLCSHTTTQTRFRHEITQLIFFPYIENKYRLGTIGKPRFFSRMITQTGFRHEITLLRPMPTETQSSRIKFELERYSSELFQYSLLWPRFLKRKVPTFGKALKKTIMGPMLGQHRL